MLSKLQARGSPATNLSTSCRVLASGEALPEELAFRRVAGEVERCVQVGAGRFGVSVTEFKFAERGKVEGIACQAGGVGDGGHRFGAALGPMQLSNRDGAVEGHDRGRANRKRCAV